MQTIPLRFFQRTPQRLVLVGLVLMCGLMYLALGYTRMVYASGTNLAVTTLGDNMTTDGNCTLREAILTANGAPANADCGANNGAP